MAERAVRTKERVEDLVAHFQLCLGAYLKAPPFSEPQQLRLHQQTIDRRFALGSAAAMLEDDWALRKLHATLRAWGLGARGSILVSETDFVAEMRKHGDEIAALEGYQLADPALRVEDVWPDLWQLMDSLAIVLNTAKLVACSKALHHLLPNLVVPMDRQYTGTFFGWYDNEFEYRQKPLLRDGFRAFANVARQVNPASFVADGWCTSPTKVIDNALVGYCMVKGLKRHAAHCG